jgi:uncharacterized repeat protein (TIGR01451 family)/fimbrial isopeptide formation D2 family protein
MKNGYPKVISFCLRLIAMLTSLLGLRAPFWSIPQHTHVAWRYAPNWQRRLLPILVFGMGFWCLPHGVQAQQLTLLKMADSNTVASGQTVTFTLTAGCSSELDNCEGAILVDVLPDYMEIDPNDPLQLPSVTITSAESGNNFVIVPVYDPVLRTITWDFTVVQPENGIPDGESFTLQYTVTIPPGVTPNNTTLQNMATISSDAGVPTTTSEEIEVVANPLWELSKNKVGSRPIYHDEPITYRITVDPTTMIGNVDLTNVVITDILPAGAVFQSASVTPTTNTLPGDPTMEGNTLTWGPLDLSVTDGPYVIDVTVVYPYTNDPMAVNYTLPESMGGMGTPKSNQVSLTAEALGDPINIPVALDDTDDTPLSPPSFGLGLVKTARDGGILPD